MINDAKDYQLSAIGLVLAYRSPTNSMSHRLRSGDMVPPMLAMITGVDSDEDNDEHNSSNVHSLSFTYVTSNAKLGTCTWEELNDGCNRLISLAKEDGEGCQLRFKEAQQACIG